MTQEIINRNKLISSFMSKGDTPFSEFGDNISGEICGLNTAIPHYYTWEAMKFHSSWDWLMPVVEKIERLDNDKDIFYRVEISRNSVFISGNFQSVDEDGVSTIDAVWNGIVKFINWYNANAKPNTGEVN